MGFLINFGSRREGNPIITVLLKLVTLFNSERITALNYTAALLVISLGSILASIWSWIASNFLIVTCFSILTLVVISKKILRIGIIFLTDNTSAAIKTDGSPRVTVIQH